MKLTLGALLVAMAAASATPAAACDFFNCATQALADDSFPPGELALPPTVQFEVHARMDKGLSQAGFYNDPAFAFAAPVYRTSNFVGYVRDPGYAPGYSGHRRGPHVVMSPYGRREYDAHND